MSKVAITFKYTCDHPGCNATEVFGEWEYEQICEKKNWMIVYPEDPDNELDCKCYCPKHKHISYTKPYDHVIGTPNETILEGNVLTYQPDVPTAELLKEVYEFLFSDLTGVAYDVRQAAIAGKIERVLRMDVDPRQPLERREDQEEDHEQTWPPLCRGTGHTCTASATGIR